MLVFLLLRGQEKAQIWSLLMRRECKVLFVLFFLSFASPFNLFVASRAVSCSQAFLSAAANARRGTSSSSSSFERWTCGFLHSFESRLLPLHSSAAQKNKQSLSGIISIERETRTCSKTESASLFAGSQAASRVPVSNKQLKQRDQAKVQLVGEVLTHRETAEEGKEGEEERRKKLKEWRVVLHNDDVHTFECVEVAITKILPQVSRARAYDIALHAHTNGKATIMLTWEQKAREVALALQEEGLTVSILPDRIFTADV